MDAAKVRLEGGASPLGAGVPVALSARVRSAIDQRIACLTFEA